MNDAAKKISLKLKYSYLVIAKSTMLNNEFENKKKPYLKNLEKLNNEYFNVFYNKIN